MPHILVPGPWSSAEVELPDATSHHLRSVLRLRDGDSVSYTDGNGTGGVGELHAGVVVRGDEHGHQALPSTTLAVAPPVSKDRLRFIVEKACEIGVTRVRWLRTAYGGGRPPRSDKARAWAQMALEQSRGYYLTEIDDRTVEVSQLPGTLLAADRDGVAPPASCPAPMTVMVGPEGGWAPEELPADLVRITLGDRVLRTETAAVVACHVMRTTAM